MRRMMAAAGLVMAWASARAECPPSHYAPPKPELRLETSLGEPAYRNDRSKVELTMSAGNGGLAGSHNTGLTRSETEFHIRPGIWAFDAGHGRTCFGLNKVEVTWRLSPPVVDIAREYRPGSCQYKVILDHENTHVRISRDSFRRYLPEMKSKLQDMVQALHPMETEGDPQAAVQMVLKRLMAGIQPILDAQEAESRRLNAEIDTPESYRKASKMCPEW